MRSRKNTGISKHPGAISLLVSMILVFPISHQLAAVSYAYPYNPLPYQPGFESGRVLPGAAVDYASPTMADLDGDGKMEILIGGRDGFVYAVRHNGSIMWQFDGAAALNAVALNAGASAVNSAVAVDDLDGDGQVEIVAAFSAPPLTGYNGGVAVLNSQGALLPGWPQLSLDHICSNCDHADGWIDGFWGSPAVGDLDGDGDMEIVDGSWDMRLYAWHHDGRLVEGWPRFLYNTTWSSPVLADLDKDGRLEVIVGADDNPGGVLLVFRGDGTDMPGFPREIDQTIFSSPAVGDINGDGWLDIIVGTGSFYANKGFQIHAWSHTGTYLPGWPVNTGGFVLSSPSLGDIDGDGAPEVVVGCNDGKLYAINGDGTFVPGWPAMVYANYGNTGPLNYSSPVLANFDGDGLPEVFITTYCDVMVLDGNGTYLTQVGNDVDSGLPSMFMKDTWCMGNTAAVGDIDLDGKLEIARAAGNGSGGGQAVLHVWESDRGTPTTAWPMFRRDAAHHANWPTTLESDARVAAHSLPEIMRPGETREATIVMRNAGYTTWNAGDQIRLVAEAGDLLGGGASISLPPGASIAPNQTVELAVTLLAPSTPGYYLTTWRMRDGQGRWFGLSAFRYVKVSNEPAFHVLVKKAVPVTGGASPAGATTGILAGGLATEVSPPANFWNWPAAKHVDFTPDLKGYYMLDAAGAVWAGGNADPIGFNDSSQGFAAGGQEILVRRDGTSWYVLDQYGKMHPSHGAYTLSPLPSLNTARSAALTPDERGVYILDANGNVHLGGRAPALTSPTPTFPAPVARRIKLTASGTGYYVLDAYGHLWNGGTAPFIEPNYDYREGQDWARDFELTDDGRGYYLLDREGNIRTGGTAFAPGYKLPQAWPQEDAALALVVGDSRVLHGLVTVPESLSCVTAPNQPCVLAVQVGASGTESQEWEAFSEQSWISISPNAGSTPGVMTVELNPRSLGAGIHEGQVIVKNDISTVTLTVRIAVSDQAFRNYLPFVQRRG